MISKTIYKMLTLCYSKLLLSDYLEKWFLKLYTYNTVNTNSVVVSYNIRDYMENWLFSCTSQWPLKKLKWILFDNIYIKCPFLGVFLLLSFSVWKYYLLVWFC